MAGKTGHGLDEAYSIETPDDAVRLYDDWALTYDRSFAQSWGYVAPREVAALFRAVATEKDEPVLDIGAGTGLLASQLEGYVVDGIDISKEMLAVAGSKGLYRERLQADLTQPLDLECDSYAGFVSCGTFTHGHVGPVCLPELLRIAKPDALFCLGTIPAVFDQAGFGSAFALMVADEQITPVTFKAIPIYEGVDHPHAGDRGLVAIFRKKGKAWASGNPST